MPTRRRAGAGRDRTSRLMLEIRGKRRQADAAALTEQALGKGRKFTQSTVSRAEQGTYTLDPDDAAVYATALGATDAQRDELVALCAAAQAHSITGHARLVSRAAEIQRRVRELEAQSTLMRAWQPTLVPAVLQTWDYTLALIERTPDEPWAEQRRARTAQLDDPGRHFHLVLSEAALHWTIGSRAVMAAQLDHLNELSHRPNVDIGILAFGQTDVPPPETAFHLYSDRAAVVATGVGTTFLTDRADLDLFVATFDRLAGVAVHGAQAREAIARVRREYEAPDD